MEKGIYEVMAAMQKEHDRMQAVHEQVSRDARAIRSFRPSLPVEPYDPFASVKAEVSRFNSLLTRMN